MVTPGAALFYRFAVALGIGIIIGFERERRRKDGAELFAGVRTFAMFALAGCTAALISDAMGSPLVLAVTLAVVGALLVVAYFGQYANWGLVAEEHHALRESRDPGLTTEIGAYLTVLVGALCYYNYVALALALGVAMLVLLSLKPQLHRFAEQLTYDDIYAALKFAVVSLVILPILPNRSFFPPPFDVLNPYNIWLMVVLISAINFAGYVLMKTVGATSGIGLTGLLGGLASSTAVTWSFSKRSKEQAALSAAYAVGIAAAWMVMFWRLLVVVAVVNRAMLAELWPPMAAAGLVALVYGYALFRRQGRTEGDGFAVANPFELGPALQFGAIYAMILVVARAAELYFGNAGVYVSSIISGLADLDGITLSLAQLSKTGEVTAIIAAQGVTLAALSNTVVKAAIVTGAGTPLLRRLLLPVTPLLIAAALLAAWYV